jgi:hypothetical protein
MTNKQLKQQVKKMLKESNKRLLEKFDSLLLSGCIYKGEIKDMSFENFSLAKKMFWALLQNETNKQRPLDRKNRKDAENMGLFI